MSQRDVPVGRPALQLRGLRRMVPWGSIPPGELSGLGDRTQNFDILMIVGTNEGAAKCLALPSAFAVPATQTAIPLPTPLKTFG